MFAIQGCIPEQDLLYAAFRNGPSTIRLLPSWSRFWGWNQVWIAPSKFVLFKYERFAGITNLLVTLHYPYYYVFTQFQPGERKKQHQVFAHKQKAVQQRLSHDFMTNYVVTFVKWRLQYIWNNHASFLCIISSGWVKSNDLNQNNKIIRYYVGVSGIILIWIIPDPMRY